MEYRDCNICQEPQEITPEALIAWEDVVVFHNCKPLTDYSSPCLCTDCFWSIKDSRLNGAANLMEMK